MARTAAVNAITIGQAFYLLNSRFRLDSSLHLAAHKGNRLLPLGFGAAAVLQLLFIFAPPLQAMFGVAGLPFWVWPWLLLGGILFFLIVEGEKALIRATPALKGRVTTIEAGQKFQA